jgi:hypothetical protein
VFIGLESYLMQKFGNDPAGAEFVIPAQAGIQTFMRVKPSLLDPRLRA